MSHYLTLLFLVIFSYANSQEKELVWTAKTCESGIEDAKDDFEKEKYFCYSYGLVFEVDPEFSRFYEKYIFNKYKIISKNAGCIVSDYSECYSEKMNFLVLKKFGNDIFEKTLKEAKEIFYSEKK